METEAAAQESLGLGKLGTQAEKDRRLKKKQVWRFSSSFFQLLLTLYYLWEIKKTVVENNRPKPLLSQYSLKLLIAGISWFY